MGALSLLLFLFPPQADGDGLDKEAIRSVVRDNIKEIRSCYKAALEQDADLEGRISLRLKITSSGSVDDATVLDADFDGGVPSCVAKSARSWKFPTSKAKTVVTYPFRFKPE